MSVSINNSCIKVLIISCLFTSLQGCQQFVDLEFSDFEQTIVIFGVLEQDSVPKIFVSEAEPNFGYIDTTFNYELIKGATVEISDGVQTWQLKPDSAVYIPSGYFNTNTLIFGNESYKGTINKRPFYTLAFTTDMNLKADENYTVKVNKNGKIASASSTVIKRLENIRYEYRFFRNFLHNVKPVIKNKRLEQFYRGILNFKSTIYSCSITGSWDSGEITDSSDVVLFEYSDYTSKFEVDEAVLLTYYPRATVCYSRTQCGNFAPFYDSVEVKIAVQLIDSNLVSYMDQLQFQKEVDGNPFLEPAPVDNNVENGIGILSSISTSEWESFWVKCR